jgi:hypothetical protein
VPVGKRRIIGLFGRFSRRDGAVHGAIELPTTPALSSSMCPTHPITLPTTTILVDSGPLGCAGAGPPPPAGRGITRAGTRADVVVLDGDLQVTRVVREGVA